jgi:tetratricopeptide (TPR) repeat protein
MTHKKRYIIILFVLFIATLAWGSEENVFIAKGALCEKDGKFKCALENFNKAAAINPKKSEVFLAIGRIYRDKLNIPEAAISNYKKGLKYNPGNFEIYRALMYTFFDIDFLDEGMRIYERLSQINYKDKKYSLTRKVVDKLSKEMSRKDFIALSKKYLSMNPTDVILRELIAIDYSKKQNYLEAKRQYELLLEHSSNKGPIYFSLAVCEYNLNNFDNARMYFKKAEALGKDIPKEYYEIIEGKRDEATR